MPHSMKSQRVHRTRLPVEQDRLETGVEIPGTILQSVEASVNMDDVEGGK